MTREIADLVDALEPADPPAVDPARFLVESARRRKLRRARRRILAAGLAGLVAIALLAGLPPVWSAWRGSGVVPPAAPSVDGPRTSALTSRLAASTAGEWSITPAIITDELSYGTVTSGTTQRSGSVAVYEAGAFDPTAIQLGVPVQVNDKPGLYRAIALDADQSRRIATVAWQWSPGAWAVVEGDWVGVEDARAAPVELMVVAEAVKIVAPTPYRLPVRLAYLPTGIHAASVSLTASLDHHVRIEFAANVRPSGWSSETASEFAELIVTVSTARGSFEPTTTLGGEPAMIDVDGRGLIVARDGYWLTISNGIRQPALTTDEYDRIFSGITVASWSDPDTWYSSIDILPR